MKKLFALAWLLLTASLASAQVTIPFDNFRPQQIISSGEFNANFSALGDQGLNRTTGGIVTGHITADLGITIDLADVGAHFDGQGRVRALTLGTVGSPMFAPSGDTTTGLYVPSAGQLAIALSGVQQLLLSGGLTVRGNAIFNSSGKIPSLTTTYFASVDAGDIQFAETSFTDGAVLARLAANETISVSYDFNPGSLTADQKLASFKATYNNDGITFTGVEIDVLNTASNAASTIFNAKVGGVSKVSTTVGGKTIATAGVRITSGPINQAFLVSDTNGKGTWIPSANSSPVPAGMLAYFEAACPAGWTIKSDAANTYDGLFNRGGATFSIVGGSTTHAHTVDYPSTTSGGISADHTHTADPASTASSTNGEHNHSITLVVGDLASDGGIHDHGFTTADNGDFTATLESGATTVSAGIHNHSGTSGTANIAHTHDSGTYEAANAGNHAHSTDFPSTGSSGVSANHTHDTDIVSGATSTDSHLPAYVQVVICRKN